ncbi:MAG: glycosyltransferase family 4 protein, partial [Flavisolibacter sp.]
LMHQWWWHFYDRYEGWIHRKANHNFFISAEDMEFAIRQYRLSSQRCSIATYGIEEKKITEPKNITRKKIGLNEEENILLFNGTLDYKPNYDAVMTLADIVEPILRKAGVHYRIIITGNRAPADLVKKMLSNDRITYIGYAEDVDLYYQAADLFLNPVTNDSGVKTKVIEAIANNCSVVSTESGISGIAMETCANKIYTIKDHDWKKFAEIVLQQLSVQQPDTDDSFYEYYSWKKITGNVSKIIEQVAHE